eukprot:COSAG02_NODE_1428_length_12662_cov_12.695137_11_plen_98_part_00
MLAMALLVHGGLLGGTGGEAAGVDGSGEGAWTLATPAEGFLAASGTGELAHLLHLAQRSHSGPPLRSAAATGESTHRRVESPVVAWRMVDLTDSVDP